MSQSASGDCQKQILFRPLSPFQRMILIWWNPGTWWARSAGAAWSQGSYIPVFTWKWVRPDRGTRMWGDTERSQYWAQLSLDMSGPGCPWGGNLGDGWWWYLAGPPAGNELTFRVGKHSLSKFWQLLWPGSCLLFYPVAHYPSRTPCTPAIMILEQATLVSASGHLDLPYQMPCSPVFGSFSPFRSHLPRHPLGLCFPHQSAWIAPFLPQSHKLSGVIL